MRPAGVAERAPTGHSVRVPSRDEQPPIDDIVAALRRGASIDATSDGLRIREARPTPDPGDTTIAEPAIAADGYPWLYVETVETDFDLHVGFSDPFVADHDTEIERSVEFIRSLPGVASAFRQDPEEILILGTRDALRVRNSLVTWFAEQP